MKPYNKKVLVSATTCSMCLTHACQNGCNPSGHWTRDVWGYPAVSGTRHQAFVNVACLGTFPDAQSDWELGGVAGTITKRSVRRRSVYRNARGNRSTLHTSPVSGFNVVPDGWIW